MDLGIYKPIDLTEEEIVSLSDLMARSHVAFCRAAIERYGTPNTKRLRDEYKRDNRTLWADPIAEECMARLAGLENRILSGFIRVGLELANAFHIAKQRPGVTLAHYVQEVAWAIYDAIYTYNGQNRFSTYVYWCSKNRLISFVRSEGRSQRNMCPLDSMDVAVPVVDQAERNEERDAYYRAIEQAPLTALERRLVEHHMRGGKHFRKLVIQNPATKRPYTTANLYRVFAKACEKIRETYNRKKCVAA